VTIQNCVVARVGGAGFVTEDGHEVGNRFIHNLAFDCSAGVRQFPIDVREGYQGSGFWCKSMVNHFVDNISMNNRHGFQSMVNDDRAKAAYDGKIPQLAFQSSPGGPMDGNISSYQTSLMAKGNRFVCNNETGHDAWGSSGDIINQPQPVYFGLYALPVLWEDCSFAYNGDAQVQHAFTFSCSAFKNCEFLGVGNKYGNKSLVGYSRVLYFDGCLFDGLKIGAMTGRGAIFQDCIFNTQTGIQFDGESANEWPYGVTLADNAFLGEPFIFTKTDRTLDTIPLHQVTLADVYANIAEYRESIGVNDDTDPNAAEIERLRGEIVSLEQQINTATARLADLRAQLMALELESQGN
jgi:hypothetical protein